MLLPHLTLARGTVDVSKISQGVQKAVQTGDPADSSGVLSPRKLKEALSALLP